MEWVVEYRRAPTRQSVAVIRVMTWAEKKCWLRLVSESTSHTTRDSKFSHSCCCRRWLPLVDRFVGN